MIKWCDVPECGVYTDAILCSLIITINYYSSINSERDLHVAFNVFLVGFKRLLIGIESMKRINEPD